MFNLIIETLVITWALKDEVQTQPVVGAAEEITNGVGQVLAVEALEKKMSKKFPRQSLDGPRLDKSHKTESRVKIPHPYVYVKTYCLRASTQDQGIT